MTMKTSTRQVDGVTIVDCSGRITLGEGSVILKDTVKDLLSKGQKRILLNLGDVNYRFSTSKTTRKPQSKPSANSSHFPGGPVTHRP